MGDWGWGGRQTCRKLNDSFAVQSGDRFRLTYVIVGSVTQSKVVSFTPKTISTITIDNAVVRISDTKFIYQVYNVPFDDNATEN